jgi:hypothetical protein
MGKERYPNWRVLHIPTARVFEITSSHSKTLEQFKQELEIAFEFVITQVKNDDDIINLHDLAYRKSIAIGLRYKRYDDVNKGYIKNWWVHDFVDFILEFCCSADMRDEDTFKFDWSTVNPVEFEVLE